MVTVWGPSVSPLLLELPFLNKLQKSRHYFFHSSVPALPPNKKSSKQCSTSSPREQDLRTTCKNLAIFHTKHMNMKVQRGDNGQSDNYHQIENQEEGNYQGR